MLEKERKFLYKGDKKYLIVNNKSINVIKQSYIFSNNIFELRVRKDEYYTNYWDKDNKTEYTLVWKNPTLDKNIRVEIIIPLNKRIGNFILNRLSKNKIVKIRYNLGKWEEGEVFVDEFISHNLTLVEIEYKKPLKNLPEYCGEEVTDNSNYKNKNIIKNGLFNI